MTCGKSGIGWNLDTDNRDIDWYSKCSVYRLRCWRGLIDLCRTFPLEWRVETVACVQCNHQAIVSFPNLIRQSIRIDIKQIVLFFHFRSHNPKAGWKTTWCFINTGIFDFPHADVTAATSGTCTIWKALSALNLIQIPVDRLGEWIAIIKPDFLVGQNLIRKSVAVDIHKTFNCFISVLGDTSGNGYFSKNIG